MYIVTAFAIIAFILTLLESRGVLKHGMKAGFILVTALGAIHYNYGNDYIAYHNEFDYINSFSVSLYDLLSGNYFRDSGWAVINKLFGFFENGFFYLVATLTIIQNTIVYRFIKSNLERSLWPFAVFVFLFNTSFYLLSFSMLRQWFVMCVWIAMLPLITKKKVLVPFIVLFLCTYIHASSICLLPFIFIGYLPKINGKLLILTIVGILLVLWNSKYYIDVILNYFLSSDGLQSYSIYASDSLQSIGLGYLIGQIPFLVSLLYIVRNNTNISNETYSLIIASIVSYMLIPFQQSIDLISRIAMYFSVISIVSLPIVYSSIPNRFVRNSLIAIYVLMTIYSYASFFSSPVYGTNYKTFHTIFSATK